MSIYEKIRECRRNAGLTQEDAAKKLGIKRTTYANWETRKVPELEELGKLADLFNVPLDMFTSTYTDDRKRFRTEIPNDSDIVREYKELVESQQKQIDQLLEALKQLIMLGNR